MPGRDFELRLATLSYADVDTDATRPATLRIEVADTRTEKRPPSPDTLVLPPPDCETGRGLLLVAAFTARWEVVDRMSVGKVVRAELDIPAGAWEARRPLRGGDSGDSGGSVARTGPVSSATGTVPGIR